MHTTPPLDPSVRRIALTCFATAGAVPCLILLAWRLGHLGKGVFDLVGSLVIMLLGISISGWLCQRQSDSRIVRLAGLFIAAGVLAMSGLVVIQNLFGTRLGWEAWLSAQLVPASTNPRVHVFPELGFVCLLASVSCLLAFRPWGQRLAIRKLAAIPALMVSICGLIMVLCSFLQSPFFDQTNLVTGVEFSILGLGLLVASGFEVWPLRLLVMSTLGAPPQRHLVRSGLKLVLLLAFTVLATRMYYYSSQKSLAIRSAQRSLATIADLKVAQIAAWRNERLADADFLRHTPYMTRRCLEVLNTPKPAKAEEMLRDWMEALFAKNPCEQMILLDESFKLRLIHPSGSDGQLSDVELKAAEEAARSREVVVADLHRQPDHPSPHLSLVVPLVVRKEGNRETLPPVGSTILPTDHTEGILLVRINSESGVNFLHHAWPTTFQTAEAMLVRQDGNEVVCLNELRLQSDTALKLRVPLSRALIEGRAVMGAFNSTAQIQGATKGTDYRGKPVVAVIRNVPETRWVLVTKVDEEEVLSPLRRQAWITGGLAGVLFGTAILGLSLLGRQRQLNSMHRELLLERQQRESEGRFRALFESSREAIILQDRTRYLDCNPAALELFRFASKHELLAKRPGDLSPSRQPDGRDSREALEAECEAALTRGSGFFEWTFQRRDGTLFPAEMQLSRVELGGNIVVQAMVRNIADRKQAEEGRLILSKLESTGVLAGGIAHDFNNLLAVIMMNLGMAESSSTKELPYFLNAAQQATLAARNLTQQFITFALKNPTFRQPAHLTHVINESVAATLKGTHLRGEVWLEPDLLRVDIDVGQIGEVLRNLLLNAREAMPEGGTVYIRAKNLTVTLADGLQLPEGDYVQVSVRDEGHGIAAHVLPKVFDPYFSTKQRGPQKGMGMGLTVCHSIIRQHGGAITVDTQVGKGTTFVFYLPTSANGIPTEKLATPV